MSCGSRQFGGGRATIRTNLKRVRALAIVVVLGALVASAMPANAFTLVQPTLGLFVNPKVGYTTSLVQVRGTLTFKGGPCTATPETFTFTFDTKALWSRTVAACNPGTLLWDTGWSSYLVPPVPRTVGTHTIKMTIATASATFAYGIVAAPASPRPKPSPSPSPSASQSATPCTAAVPLPPAGTGGFVDNFIAGAMVAAVLPLLALTLFGPTQIFAAVGRRRRELYVLGFGLLMLGTFSCTSSVAQTSPSSTPVGVVSPTVSPSPSPSPSC